MRLAVIPARGGSKRIPRKNIKDFCGKPMIARSIEAALDSGCFDKIIVSTDDTEIAEVAKKYGASVPFMRPVDLSDDYTGTTPVVQHAVKWFVEAGELPEEVCCIYATAPFVTGVSIRAGLLAVQQPGLDYAFSVTSYAFPIQRAIRLTKVERVEMLQPDFFSARSQDLEEAFHDAGQFYWGRADAWLAGRVIFGSCSTVIRLPRHCVQDIDTPEDWLRAEFMFKAMQMAEKEV